MAQAAAMINQNVIAERLNLSIATVSRALRNQPGIHSATRSRVMELAAELGYRPLRNHQQKGPKKSSYVGVFIRSWHRGIRPLYLDGMVDMAANLDVSLVLHHTRLEDAETLLDPSRQPPALRDGTLNGVVLVHRWPGEVVKFLAERMACVSIVHQVPGIPMDTVDMDHAFGMALMARHLYQLGHRRIGFFGVCSDLAWSKSRYGGYVQALCELGLPMDPSFLIPVSARVLEDRTAPWEDEIDRAANLVRGGVTALMAASQWSASVLMRGLVDRGLRVPQDVSITGFDDTDPAGIESALKITSTRIPGEAMGAEALRRVLLRLAEPSRPTQAIHFACTFIEGQTTAAPSSDSARRAGKSRLKD
jgi:DNA-binding LacI/PurR family transcriptional regulator